MHGFGLSYVMYRRLQTLFHFFYFFRIPFLLFGIFLETVLNEVLHFKVKVEVKNKEKHNVKQLIDWLAVELVLFKKVWI